MGAATLSSRAIIGEYYRALEQDAGALWVPGISSYFTSDQDVETYPWLGQAPVLRQWVGGRNPVGFRESGISIQNQHFEATIDILVKDLRRDKTRQVFARIQELAARTNAHWASQLSTLIVNAESTACYDGQFYYDTDHEEGSSGAQSNDIGVDISTMPAGVTGTTTAPSIEEMQFAVMKGMQAILSFKDDQGEPMNEMAENFLVMVPVSLWMIASSAFARPVTDVNQLVPSNLNISVVANARLSAWTAQFAIFRTDSNVGSFIRQEETAVDLKAKAEGSEYEFDNDSHQYGVDTWRNSGYGMWQNSCLVTMT
ncbi:MAG: hypothetical protein GY799_25455 [Desulfobulbaceae bacterium]|nr:hypothetical protein [Desulfobulbaceae bacterium]